MPVTFSLYSQSCCLLLTPGHPPTHTQSHTHTQNITEVFCMLWDFRGPVPSSAWKPHRPTAPPPPPPPPPASGKVTDKHNGGSGASVGGRKA